MTVVGMAETRCWSPPDLRGHSLVLSYLPERQLIKLAIDSPKTSTFSMFALEAFLSAIEDIRSRINEGKSPAYRYLILTSLCRNIFSMGGDLSLILKLASERDLEGALAYGHKAAQVIYMLWDNLGLDLATTACVSGKAYGAGFEAALACGRIVASRNTTFCLPEKRFGLFPGMGATSFLQRRVGRSEMERIIDERCLITADGAYRLGLLETVTDSDPLQAEQDQAAEGGLAYWAKLMDQQTARKSRENYSLDEVFATTTQWAQGVVSLDASNLAALRRVAQVQEARSKGREI